MLNRKRITILNTVIIFGFLVIFLRLTDLMVFNHKNLAEKARLQQVKAEDIQVRRGNIYDRRGREFAVNIELESLYCDAGEVAIDQKRLTKLSAALGTKPEVIRARFRPDRRFIWLDRKLRPEEAKKIKAILGMDRESGTDVKGFGFLAEPQRFYPKGKLASHVVGLVGLDNQPLEGLELKYNRYLTATGGKVYLPRDAGGNMLSPGVILEAKGNDILLTIDEGLQYIVEKELDIAMEKWKAKAGVVIMMDPFTGEILALANRPTYDLNDLGDVSEREIRNRAITDIYEPGSTFKVIVGTAALEEKLVNTTTLFDCSRGGIEVGGKFIRDAHKHGVLTFKEVIQKSSNVGSVQIGMKLGKERVYKYAKLFGFGDETGIDLPGEVSGWIRKPDKWSATSIGAISIGQEVAVTPLQVLRAYSAIANGGYLVEPHVVSEIRTHDGEPVFSFGEAEKKRVISSKTASIFKDILKTVVKEGGTAQDASVEGSQVAGKTGTAQLVDPATKRYSREKFVSSFVGFVPADKPEFAMIVVIYEPRGQIYGGIVAGPVFRSIASQGLSYLDVPMEDDLEKNILLVSK
jgi:cell division protein FtsI (penicillin-binding protein 3)